MSGVPQLCARHADRSGREEGAMDEASSIADCSKAARSFRCRDRRRRDQRHERPGGDFGQRARFGREKSLGPPRAAESRTTFYLSPEARRLGPRAGISSFVPRIDEARWLTQTFRIHAMMDLSDGLGADLPRLARASGVGFEIDEKALPRTPRLHDRRRRSMTAKITSCSSRSRLTTAAASERNGAENSRVFRSPASVSLTSNDPNPQLSTSFRGYVHFQ